MEEKPIHIQLKPLNTNAGAKSVAWWEELADVINKKGAVIFSVDGLRDTNHLYRQGVELGQC